MSRKGEEVEDFIEEMRLTLLNDGMVPTFCSRKGKSYIDLNIGHREFERSRKRLESRDRLVKQLP